MTSAANAASPSSYATEGVTDETLWADADDPALIPYRRSKTRAERAAWDFMSGVTGRTGLVTVLPGAVFGPILATSTIGSVAIIGRMVSGTMRGIPRIGLEIVDVRDLADVHIRAMTSPDAAGQRFLATGEFMWMAEMARVLRDGLGADGRRVPTRPVPDAVVRFAARFTDRSLREITRRSAAVTGTPPRRPGGCWDGRRGRPGRRCSTAPGASSRTGPSRSGCSRPQTRSRRGPAGVPAALRAPGAQLTDLGVWVRFSYTPRTPYQPGVSISRDGAFPRRNVGVQE
jgi:hypothetical protein